MHHQTGRPASMDSTRGKPDPGCQKGEGRRDPTTWEPDGPSHDPTPTETGGERIADL